jgi:hypothetical protein
MLLYDFCFLAASYCDEIIHVQNPENNLHVTDRCAPWIFTSRAKNFVLQALPFQNVGVCRKILGAVEEYKTS